MQGPGQEAGGHSTKLEIAVSGRNLVNTDVFGKSDGMIVLYEWHGNAWEKVGATECVRDNLNPDFVHKFHVTYTFGTKQNLRFTVLDIDNFDRINDYHKQTLLGHVDLTLDQLVNSDGGRAEVAIVNPAKPDRAFGELIVYVEEVVSLNYTVSITMEGSNLDKKDLFGKSDPFIVISMSREDGSWVPCHRSEVVKKTLDPRWAPMEVSLQKLCNGDRMRPLKLQVFDWNRSGKHVLIGEAGASLDVIERGKREFTLINQEKQAKRKYRNSGILRVTAFEVKKEHSFYEFIAGGCEINLIVAIDFTSSNGNPTNPTSLHYVSNNPQQRNEYEQAMGAVGDILCYYDSDQLYPVYGFGAKLPPNWRVSHCFPLNGRPEDPEVYGLQGIIDVYHHALANQVRLAGPTVFSQIIRTAAEIASDSHRGCKSGNQSYQILLILTDGAINDMEQTIAEVVSASSLPLSIVIVGVGNEDFSSMLVLDADDEPLVHDGVKQTSDIVQFVPFRKYQADPKALAEQVLWEIPRQFLDYMKRNSVEPNAPVVAGAQHPVQPSMHPGNQLSPTDVFQSRGLRRSQIRYPDMDVHAAVPGVTGDDDVFAPAAQPAIPTSQAQQAPGSGHGHHAAAQPPQAREGAYAQHGMQYARGPISVAVALYDFADNRPGMLPFHAGERINILDKSNPAWWNAECRGQYGMVPSNYMQEQ